MKKTMFFLSILLIFSLKSIAIDLSIGKSTVSPTTVSAGVAFSVTCSVTNPGGGNPGGTWVNYYLSTNNSLGLGDVLLGSSVGFTTYPRTLTTSISTLCNVTPGTYYIISKVDPQNNIPETSEFNNTSAAQIIITAGLPNLTISNCNANPLNVPNNTNIFASCRVVNAGYSPSDNSTLGFYLSDNTTWDVSDVLLSSVPVGVIYPGNYVDVYNNYVNISVTGTFPQTKYLVCKADIDNIATECDENDNTNYKQIFISKPDLTIQIASITPTSTQNASVVTINGLITNNGVVKASPSFLKAYLSDDCVLDVNNDIPLYSQSYLIPDIAAGSSYVINNLAVYIPGGSVCTFPQSKYIILVADANNGLDELDELNNTACSAINIISPTVPDLSFMYGAVKFSDFDREDFYYQFGEVPSNLSPPNTCNPNAPNLGCYVMCFATIKNNTCLPLYNVKYRMTRTVIDSNPLEITTTDFIIPSILANGEYFIACDNPAFDFIKYEIDPDNVIVEGFENNNKISFYEFGQNKSAISSINNSDKESINIYPNPASDNITINNAENSNIIIYDIMGKIIISESNISKEYNLNVSNLAKGNYVVKIMNGTQVVTKKITIIK